MVETLAAWNGDQQIEPFESVFRATEHRNFWCPDDVSVLLLAESHVFTSQQELEREVVLQELHQFEGCPTGFVRLIYCLGYGENELLDEPIVNPRNSGTTQFWKIFQSCTNLVNSLEDFDPIKVSATRNSANRRQNKVELLDQMRNQGVWLIDASIMALYAPGARRPPTRLCRELLQISWLNYVAEELQDVDPTRIVCIGRGVYRALANELAPYEARLHVTPQPQGLRGQNMQIPYHQEFFNWCNQ